MVEYTFTYRDSRSQNTVVRHYRLANDDEARELACLTFERFGVAVTRNDTLIASSPSNLVNGVSPSPGLVLT